MGILWAAGRLKDKHIVFDESCLKLEVDVPFVLAAIEALFLEATQATADETFRGQPLSAMFLPAPKEEQDWNMVQKAADPPESTKQASREHAEKAESEGTESNK